MILFWNVTSTCSTKLLSLHLQYVLLNLVIIDEYSFPGVLKDLISWSPEYTSNSINPGTEFQSHLQPAANSSKQEQHSYCSRGYDNKTTRKLTTPNSRVLLAQRLD